MTSQTAEAATPATRRERRAQRSISHASAEPSPFAPLPARSAVGRESGIRRSAPGRLWLFAGVLGVAIAALGAAAPSIAETIIPG
ncbi:hypothetical protein [Microbacterium sp. NPDC087591]|uniref:hypothetical protein n=1 Tax=Microbacterium sp. NPDC087591 TaxID=3364192 RepID=UPI003808C2E3